MAMTKPSLDLLRSLTDEHVLRALMEEPQLTRAELAARTGISKPTVSESARRLSAAGLIRDTGARTSGRGRVGSYYGLAEDIGSALVASIAPHGVVAECVDSHGAVLARSQQPVGRPAQPQQVEQALRMAVAQARGAAPGPVRLAVVSAADPVDRRSGRLVHLPDAPFLVGELSPVDVLGPSVDGPVLVDNDVNWEARAERAAARPGDLDNFAYLHLGEGMGCAVVSDGEVRRGFTGIAGEVAHLVTVGPGGRARLLTEVFQEVAPRRAGTTAIDVPALLGAIAGPSATAGRLLAVIGAALGGVLSALVALCDPEVVILGGGWGAHPAVIDAVQSRFGQSPRPVPVRAAAVAEEPAHSGARDHALGGLRTAIIALASAARSFGQQA
jgi:predicted NBD/HSP70 family sugar kinase